MIPKRFVHILTPNECDLIWKKDSINLRILRWDHPGLSDKPEIQWQVLLLETGEKTRHREKHVKTEAESAGMLPKLQDAWSHQKLAKQGRILCEKLCRKHNLANTLISDSWTPELWRINFHPLKPWVLQQFVTSPQIQIYW